MIFETHAHYDDKAFDSDRDALLLSFQEHGIGTVVNACASADGMEDTIALMEKYSFIYGAIGVHPDDAGRMTEETLEKSGIFPAMKRLWQSGRSDWIIIGIKKKKNIAFSRKCSGRRWRLRGKKSCLL